MPCLCKVLSSLVGKMRVRPENMLHSNIHLSADNSDTNTIILLIHSIKVYAKLRTFLYSFGWSEGGLDPLLCF